MKTWIQRKKESPRDFYQTNPRMVKALISEYHKLLSEKTCLDPCCGKHVMKAVFNAYGISLDEFDLFPCDENTPRIDFLDCGNVKDLYDTVVMNPPYSSKYLFLDYALNNFNNVFCLLPEISLNYNLINKKYLSSERYYGKIKMFPKMYLHENTSDLLGGTTCYSWLCFLGANSVKHKTEIIIDLFAQNKGII